MKRTLADVCANLRQAAGVARVLSANHDHTVAAVGKCGCCLLSLTRGGADRVDYTQFLHARGDGGHDLGQVLRGLGGLYNQAHLALERQRIRIGGAAHDLSVITGMAQDALNLGVARLAHDNHAVALAYQALRRHVDFFHVGAGGIDYVETALASGLDHLRHHAVRADDHGARCGVV